MGDKRKTIINLIVFIFVLFLIGFIFWKYFGFVFSDSESLKNFVEGFGTFGPIIFIILTIIQIFLAPFPGQIAGLAGGYLFGAFLGTIYSMIGLIIGSWLVFLLSKKFGRPFVEVFVEKEHLSKFDKLTSKRGPLVIFLMFLIPGLPDDALCYFCGLTNIKIKDLVVISTVGRFPGFLVLNLLGAGFASSNMILILIISSIIALMILFIYIFRKKVEHFIMKLSN